MLLAVRDLVLVVRAQDLENAVLDPDAGDHDA
jgi:hypothetical protein